MSFVKCQRKGCDAEGSTITFTSVDKPDETMTLCVPHLTVELIRRNKMRPAGTAKGNKQVLPPVAPYPPKRYRPTPFVDRRA